MGYILYDNVLRGSTVTSDDSTGIASALDGRTSSSALWTDTGATRTTVIDCATAQSVDALGIGRNNLGTQNATVVIAGSSNNSSYTTLFTITPADDSVVMESISSVSYRYYRIQITAQDADVYITDIALGVRLDLERDQKGGYISPEFADGDQITPNTTRGQNLAGLTLKTGFKSVTINLPYYTRSGFFSYWADFIASAKQYPFYIVWDLAGNEQPFYCWFKKKIPQPQFSKNVPGYAYLNGSMILEGLTV